jgi:ABC-type sugar transport system ATPase subunit
MIETAFAIGLVIGIAGMVGKGVTWTLERVSGRADDRRRAIGRLCWSGAVVGAVVIVAASLAEVVAGAVP